MSEITYMVTITEPHMKSYAAFFPPVFRHRPVQSGEMNIKGLNGNACYHVLPAFFESDVPYLRRGGCGDHRWDIEMPVPR
jgi:hypothetical protein